jgi:hypothetical protein
MSNMAPRPKYTVGISLIPHVPVRPQAVCAGPEDIELCCRIYPVLTFWIACHRLVNQVKSCTLVQILDELSAGSLKKERDAVENSLGWMQ